MAVTRHADAVAPVRSSGPVRTWLMRHVAAAVGAGMWWMLIKLVF